MKVLILTSPSGEWEALYIDGKLIDEGEVLGEGDSRLYMLKMAEKHGFKSSDVVVTEMTLEDDKLTNEMGCCFSDNEKYTFKY